MSKGTPYQANVTLLDTATSVGLADVTSIKLNGKWLEQPYIGCFIGTLASIGAADKIQVWVSPNDVDFVSVQTYATTAFADVVNGPWPFIKFTKAGNQTGKIIGIFEQGKGN